jgi:hypothetical protein
LNFDFKILWFSFKGDFSKIFEKEVKIMVKGGGGFERLFEN